MLLQQRLDVLQQRDTLGRLPMAEGRDRLRAHGVADEPHDFHRRLLNHTQRSQGEECVAGPHPVYNLARKSRNLDEALARVIAKAPVLAPRNSNLPTPKPSRDVTDHLSQIAPSISC